MQVNRIMTPNPEYVSPFATLRDAARTMARMDVGSLPVSDGHRVLGILTDRDITIRATARGLDPDRTHVENVATQEIAFCYDDQDVKEAAKIMKDRQIRRLPVVSRRDEHLVGMLALGDVACRSTDSKTAGDILEQVSQPTI